MRPWIFLLLLFCSLYELKAQNRSVGLLQYDTAVCDGYVFFAPVVSTDVYLIDNCGELVHNWSTTNKTGAAAYLMENGDLLRAAVIPNNIFSNGSGGGGLLERRDWNGNLLWYYPYSDILYHQHHDIQPLPNGNILVISWERKTLAEAIAAGRDTMLSSDLEVWPDFIAELEPVGANAANVIWRWHAWDHLIQDFDSTKANYGVVADHPELIDVNYAAVQREDWLHSNAVKYNADLDQIIISAHEFNELWIIDHSTTTAEAAGHNGGRWGKGGDLLYRWGNPAAYKQGTSADQKFFGQHDTHWIPDSLTDGGKIMVYNNGLNRPQGAYSSVEILEPIVDSLGNYVLQNGRFGPDSVTWMYQDIGNFYSYGVSGAQRLENGNTLICEGRSGRFFEITPQQQVIWQYKSPVDLFGIVSQGDIPTSNIVFRVHRYPADYSAFSGRVLTAQGPLEYNPLPSICDSIAAAMEINTTDAAFPLLSQYADGFLLEQSIQYIENLQIEIFDIQGHLLYQTKTKESRFFYSLQGQCAGLYCIKVTLPEFGKSETYKFLKL